MLSTKTILYLQQKQYSSAPPGIGRGGTSGSSTKGMGWFIAAAAPAAFDPQMSAHPLQGSQPASNQHQQFAHSPTNPLVCAHPLHSPVWVCARQDLGANARHRPRLPRDLAPCCLDLLSSLVHILQAGRVGGWVGGWGGGSAGQASGQVRHIVSGTASQLPFTQPPASRHPPSSHPRPPFQPHTTHRGADCHLGIRISLLVALLAVVVRQLKHRATLLGAVACRGAPPGWARHQWAVAGGRAAAGSRGGKVRCPPSNIQHPPVRHQECNSFRPSQECNMFPTHPGMPGCT